MSNPPLGAAGSSPSSPSPPPTTSVSSPPPPPAPPGAGSPLAPARRYGGQTRLAGTVVAKLAKAAAEEVDGVSHASIIGAPNAFLLPGSTGEPDGESSRRDLRVHLSAGFAYPASVQSTAEEVRRHVRQQVSKLIGQPLTRIDLTVAELVPPGAHAGAGKRVE